jgi:PilZ domain
MSEAQTCDERPDRRRTRRHHTIHDHGIVSARVRPGREASLLDVSAGGALVETTYRLLPGSRIELHVATGACRTSVRGGVLRSAVVGVRAAGMCYRSAIEFDRLLSGFVDGDAGGYGVPIGNIHSTGSPG